MPAMTFDILWEELCQKQPRLREGSEQVYFTVSIFQQLMRKAYERGRAQEVLARERGLGDIEDNLRTVLGDRH
jgi:hypothetical protein